MRSIVHIVVAVLLIISADLSVAEAADILPCADALQSSNLITPYPQTQMHGRHVAPQQVHHHHPAAALHCGIASPFSNAVLTECPASALCPQTEGLLFLPVIEQQKGVSPDPLRTPPRA
ncbi:MAG: hypothetical protein ACOH2L_16730 [Devosia sp.]